jgi:TRAP-type mannitol/chloroaromatic compound transport system substrate-binding protein
LIRVRLLEAALEKAGMDKDKFGQRDAEKLSQELEAVTRKSIHERTLRNHVKKLRYEQTWGYLAAYVLSSEFTLEELKGEKGDFFPAYKYYAAKVKDQILSEVSNPPSEVHNPPTYNRAIIFCLTVIICFLTFLLLPKKEQTISIYANPHSEDTIIRKHLKNWESLMNDALPQYKFELTEERSTGKPSIQHTVLYYSDGKESGQLWQNLLTNVPFGLDFIDYQDWYWKSSTQLMLDNLMNDTLMNTTRSYFIPLGNTGFQSGGWYIVDNLDTIKYKEDISNYMIRMFGLGSDVVRRLGSGVHPDLELSLEEICEQIKNHDGKFAFEYINAGADALLRYDRAVECPYVVANKLKLVFYEKGWHEPSTTWNLKIPILLWNKFSESEKAIIQAISKAVTQEVRTDYQLKHQEQMERWNDLEEKGELKFTILEQFPQQILDSLIIETQEVFTRLYRSSQGETAKKIFESYNDYLIEKKGINLILHPSVHN